MVYDYIPSNRKDLKSAYPIGVVPGLDYFKIKDAASTEDQSKKVKEEVSASSSEMINYFKCDDCDFVTESEDQIEAHVAAHEMIDNKLDVVEKKRGRPKKS